MVKIDLRIINDMSERQNNIIANTIKNYYIFLIKSLRPEYDFNNKIPNFVWEIQFDKIENNYFIVVNWIDDNDHNFKDDISKFPLKFAFDEKEFNKWKETYHKDDFKNNLLNVVKHGLNYQTLLKEIKSDIDKILMEFISTTIPKHKNVQDDVEVLEWDIKFKESNNAYIEGSWKTFSCYAHKKAFSLPFQFVINKGEFYKHKAGSQWYSNVRILA